MDCSLLGGGTWGSIVVSVGKEMAISLLLVIVAKNLVNGVLSYDCLRGPSVWVIAQYVDLLIP